MLERLKVLTNKRLARIPLTLLTSAGTTFAAMWTVAEALGYQGSPGLFAYVALVSGLLSTNAIWLVEYIALSRQHRESAELLSQIQEVGLTRRHIDYKRYVQSCEREIRLWGLSLHSFSTTRMIESLVQRLKSSSLNIRILLLDPDAPFAEYRCRQRAYAGKEQGYLRETIQRSIVQFGWMGSRLQEEFRSDIWRSRCDVRIYNDYPSMGLSLFDDDAIVSHYFHSVSGSNVPYVVYHRTEGGLDIYSWVVSEFDEIWGRAPSIFDADMTT
jgi:hypothetical protein